jgi:hypothetical protein
MNAKVGKPVVVADFNGTLAGAGASFTTMTCTDDFNYELWESLGSPGSPPPFPRVSVNGSTMKTAPVLIQFYKTPLVPGEDPAAPANRIEIRNLRCRSVMIGELLELKWMDTELPLLHRLTLPAPVSLWSETQY